MKRIFFTLLTLLLTLSAMAASPKNNEAYLFVYFTNNHPSGEQLRYAVSLDGYNYTPLNNGEKVWDAGKVARTGCIRDPHILRAEDGKTFYMVMTDMKSSDGWSSNDGIVMMKSKDLINWEATAVDFPTVFPDLYTREGLTRVWAPQTIYDREAKKYMVYYSLEYEGQYLTIFYSYADKNFTKLSRPEKLADFGEVVLDADIIPTDTAYHMFLSGIDKATSKSMKGPWRKERMRHVQPHKYVAEGPAVYKLNNSDEWALLYDCFRNGEFHIAKSSDLEKFEPMVQFKNGGKFSFRHGTAMGITSQELERLLETFPSDGVTLESLKRSVLPEKSKVWISKDNPIFKHQFTADPAPVVWGDTLWLFCGHDVPGKRVYNIPEWSLFSTADMRHWQQWPSPMKIEEVTWDRSKNAYAAHAIKGTDGRYYFYFSTNGSGIGVAVSDKPEGPYKDALGSPLITNDMCPWATHGWRCIDPAAFIDDDGQAWLFWGNGVPYYAKLKPNMVEFDSPVMRLDLKDKGYTFTEAPWIHKHNGKYYFTYATLFPEKLAYAVADRIDGQYDTKGLLAEVAGNSNTTHPGIVKFKDKWYLFTHDGTLEDGSGKTRAVTVYELKHNDDGTIEKCTLDSKGIW